jgi:hypothetical protein
MRVTTRDLSAIPISDIHQEPARKWASVVYFVMGQAGWFACVLSAAKGVPWLGTLAVLALVVLHLLRTSRPIAELKLLAFVAVTGGVWESALVLAGLLAYSSGNIIPGMAPYWMPALWVLFAAQFNTTYRWLKSRLWLAPIVGAIAGPLSFRAGAELGALHFVKPVPAAVALAVGWAVLLTLITVMSRRWDGARDASVS